MFRVPVALLAPIVLLLSGCSGGGTVAGDVVTTREVLVDAAPVEVTAETGGIDGVVVDEEKLPVGGVGVVLVGYNSQTVSDQNGRFTFSDLEPLEYKLSFKKSGFATAGRAVPVTAGEIAQVQVTLKTIAFDVPFHETGTWTGIVLAGYFVLNAGDAATPGGPSCSACLVPCDSCVTEFNTTRGLRELVFELEAQAWLDSPIQPNDYFWQLLGRSKDYDRYAADYWADRGQRSVKGGWPEGGEDFRFTNQCGLFFPCVNQRFTVYFTEFYFQGATANFTALPPEA